MPFLNPAHSPASKPSRRRPIQTKQHPKQASKQKKKEKNSPWITLPLPSGREPATAGRDENQNKYISRWCARGRGRGPGASARGTFSTALRSARASTCWARVYYPASARKREMRGVETERAARREKSAAPVWHTDIGMPLPLLQRARNSILVHRRHVCSAVRCRDAGRASGARARTGDFVNEARTAWTRLAEKYSPGAKGNPLG